MKIACIGNMNNMYFSLIRYLRDHRQDVDLFLYNNEFDHFSPEADSFNDNYKGYTKRLSWGKWQDLSRISKDEIRDEFKEYSFIIACGTAPAFLNFAGLHIDIFVPYGGDLYDLPFFKLKRKFLSYYKFSHHQRAGIKDADHIVMDATNEYHSNRTFKRLGVESKRIEIGFPMIYMPQYELDNLETYYDECPCYQEFMEIREKHDLVVFHQARHVWKTFLNDFASKGNDKLIKGFAAFVKANLETKACMICFDYGVDVDASKELIGQLGIENNVFWFPKMKRKNLMVGLSLADIGTGQFFHSWLSSGTIYEPLVMSKPLIHYREDDLYKDVYPELYPVLNVKNEKDVTEKLNDYIKRPDYYKEMGVKGRHWFQEYVVDRSIEVYLGIINKKQARINSEKTE